MEPFEKIQLSFKCPKAFDELQPCNSNWYCDGCQKMVYDFRGMEEEQILDAFAKSGKKLCGIYDANRIKVLPQKPNWYRWASVVLLSLTACAKNITGEPYATKTINPREENVVKQSADAELVVGFFATEVRPSFPGGELAFAKYIAQHIKIKAGQTYRGRVYVAFTVERDGTLTDITIAKGGDPQLNEQIINVVKNSPHWKPGIENGKAVQVRFTVPINLTGQE